MQRRSNVLSDQAEGTVFTRILASNKLFFRNTLKVDDGTSAMSRRNSIEIVWETKCTNNGALISSLANVQCNKKNTADVEVNILRQVN